MKKVRHQEMVPARPIRGPDRDLVASQVLAFLAADPERLGRFLALTGLDPPTIRASAASPGFTSAVLAYLAGDEALLVEFARNAGHDPEHVGRLAQMDQRPWSEGD